MVHVLLAGFTQDIVGIPYDIAADCTILQQTVRYCSRLYDITADCTVLQLDYHLQSVSVHAVLSGIENTTYGQDAVVI